MFFGTRVDEERPMRLLDRHTAAGGAFLDTANNYAFWVPGGRGGESETLLGRWMRRRSNRDRVFVATKIGGAPGEDLSRAAIRAAVEGSLRRLGTDHLDLYYAHIDHRPVALEKTLGAFGDLVTAGKVRHVGCSNHTAWRVERARRISDVRGLPRYCCIQQRHSYVRPRPGADLGTQLAADDELLDYCSANPEVALLAYSPLLSGAYTVPERAIPAQYPGPDTDAARRPAGGRTRRPRERQPGRPRMADGQEAPCDPAHRRERRAAADDNLGALAVALSPQQLAMLNVVAA
jgi:aryl-alcohol dehydrogenase-like predicted oxidoreductase